MAGPSLRQIERHIHHSAEASENVTFTVHARTRMRGRRVTDPMVMEVLRLGRLDRAPEPDIRHPGLKCWMQRFVAGVQVAVVVYVEYPAPGLTVVTVIDVRKE